MGKERRVKVKPWQPPVTVKPIPVDGFKVRKEHKGEQALMDRAAAERMRVTGTDISYYALDLGLTKVDPLYMEPTERVYRGPFKLVGNMQWPDGMPEVREEGLRMTYVVQAWISRVEFEEKRCPLPNEGDVIQVWKNPYFQTHAVIDEQIPNAGYYFTVVDVDDDGHSYDNPHFVGFVLDLRRNTEFTPERRIFPP